MSLSAALVSLRAALVEHAAPNRGSDDEAVTAVDLCMSLSTITKEDLIDLFEICGPLRDFEGIAKHLDQVERLGVEELRAQGVVRTLAKRTKFESPSDEVRARLRAWHLEYVGKVGK